MTTKHFPTQSTTQSFIPTLQNREKIPICLQVVILFISSINLDSEGIYRSLYAW